jgi:hypothetical protein
VESSRHIKRVVALISSVLLQNMAPGVALFARTGRWISNTRTFSAEFVGTGRRAPVRLVRLKRRFFGTRKLSGRRALGSWLGVDDYRTLAAVGVARRKFRCNTLRNFYKTSTGDELRSSGFLNRMHDRLFDDGFVSSIVAIYIDVIKAFLCNVRVFGFCRSRLLNEERLGLERVERELGLRSIFGRGSETTVLSSAIS